MLSMEKKYIYEILFFLTLIHVLNTKVRCGHEESKKLPNKR